MCGVVEGTSAWTHIHIRRLLLAEVVAAAVHREREHPDDRQADTTGRGRERDEVKKAELNA